MTAQFFEAAELASVDPAAAAQYLSGTGWREIDAYGRGSVWSKTADDRAVQVLLPDSNELDDYPVRMSELLRTVSLVDARPESEILRELRFPLLDTQYIRTMPDTPSGTTPLEAGFRAVRGVRELFRAAAISAALAEPPVVLPADKPEGAAHFLDQVRLGTPIAGSFVLRVETPVEEPTVEHVGPLGNRSVLRYLYTAVRAAHDAAAESATVGTPRPFEGKAEQGVSANLCGALADIGGTRRTPFEIRWSWASGAPLNEPTPQLRFGETQVEALHDAQKHLREMANTVPATVEGRPVDLRKRAPERTGRVVVEGTVHFGGRTVRDRRVVMRLPRPRYDDVLAAHSRQRTTWVRVSGALKTRGRQWELVTVDEVSVHERPS